MSALNIQVVIQNNDQSPEIYTGQDNTLTIQYINNTGKSITLNGGKAINPPPPADGPADFLLDFSMLYEDPDDQKKITLTATGWDIRFFPDPDYPVWAAAPTNTLQWEKGETIEFTADKINPTSGTGTVYVSSELYNLGAEHETLISTTLLINEPPASGKDLTLTMSFNAVANPPDPSNGKNQKIPDIGITKDSTAPYVNTLQLTFLNKSGNTPIVPDKVPWDTNPPQFIVSFVPSGGAPGYYALTTPDAINAFGFDLAKGTSGWKTPQKTLGSPATWILEPDPSNHAILGIQGKAIAQFNVTNIITDFINGPTLLYVQYRNIPGYNDGYFASLLNKQYPPMAIRSFSVTPQQIIVGNNTLATAQLNWDVDDATYIEISGLGKVASSGAAVAVPCNMNSSFVLTAIDMIVGDLQTASSAITFRPAISQRWTPVGSIVAWSGGITDIPAGWALCDGNNGTPDLKDLFIMGAGGSKTPGQTDPLPVHQHMLSGFKVTAQFDNAGSHTHSLPANWYARNFSCGHWAGFDVAGSGTNSKLQNAGEHTHQLNVDFSQLKTDANTTALLPDWYAMCYIMLLNPS
ncbi:hypothetical protein [Arachidicoccus terrestris]|uniref:hypothetical protein n=1 Tax=Arachidicoccus terrestris TaxID=2875539 RepID=UPI001CC63846|nr:hypothetical protein [Arachidicoccus terrestris]UAY54334.1 hypothetical protein K9M52_12830 [Arachidicoccus terrestris]